MIKNELYFTNYFQSDLFACLTILMKDFSKTIQNILYRDYLAEILKLTECVCSTKFNYRDICLTVCIKIVLILILCQLIIGYIRFINRGKFRRKRKINSTSSHINLDIQTSSKITNDLKILASIGYIKLSVSIKYEFCDLY